ncbi:tail fiber domain-containing protein [Vibrio owensii]|uniref:tail fiber domain-containing protein n=1 Tax=Vibrio owensii TaxID=696485 RepID=UPI003393C3D6
MQHFQIIQEDDTLYESLSKINESLRTVLSSNSGSRLPTEDTQDLVTPGQFFYSTTEDKLYQLRVGTANNWKMIIDLTKTPTNREYVDNQINTHDHDSDYLGINAKAVDVVKVNGKPASDVFYKTQVTGDESDGDPTHVWNAQLTKKIRDDFNTWLEVVGDPDEVIAKLEEIIAMIEANEDILENLQIENIFGLRDELDNRWTRDEDVVDMGGVAAAGGIFTGSVQFNNGVFGPAGAVMLKGVGSDVFLENGIETGALILKHKTNPVVMIGTSSTRHPLYHKGIRDQVVADMVAGGLIKKATADNSYLGLHSTADNSNRLNNKISAVDATASSIASRDGSGNLVVNHIRTNAGEYTDHSKIEFCLGQVAVGEGADNYARPVPLADMKSAMNINNLPNWSETTFDNRFVKKAGDTLTGSLRSNASFIINEATGTGKEFAALDGSNRAVFRQSSGGAFIGFADDGGTGWVGYIRIKDKFTYTKGSTEYEVYHEGHKPTASEIGALGKTEKASNSNYADYVNNLSNNPWNKNIGGRLWVSSATQTSEGPNPGQHADAIHWGHDGSSKYYHALYVEHNTTSILRYATKSGTGAWKKAALYSTLNKPTWADVGGNSWFSLTSGHTLVESDRWLRAASASKGLLPFEAKTGGAAVSSLGLSSWWFKDAWVNSYRGGSVNVSGKITGIELYTNRGVYSNDLPDTHPPGSPGAGGGSQQICAGILEGNNPSLPIDPDDNPATARVYVGNPQVAQTVLETKDGNITSYNWADRRFERIYHQGYKPTWADVGGNSYIKVSGSYLKVGGDKWLQAGSNGTGFLPAANNQSNIGTSSLRFKTGYINSLVGSAISLSGKLTAAQADIAKHLTDFNCEGAYKFYGKTVVGGTNDGWLRLNADSNFGSGIFCGSTGVLRHDARIEVGSAGSGFYANTANVFSKNGLIVRSPNTHNTDSVKVQIGSHSSWGANKNAYLECGGGKPTGSTATYVWRYRDTAGARLSALEVLDQSGQTRLWAGKSSKYVTFETSGGITAQSTITSSADVVAYSDMRLKDNIEVISNPLDKISKIRGVTFSRNDIEDDRRYAGVIAQEVLEVLPEVVHGSEDEQYSVAYGNMVGLLIEAVKELKSEIEQLKGEREV